MTDHLASPQQGPLSRYSDPSSPSSARDHDRARQGQASRGSLETGESSLSGSLLNGAWSASTTVGPRLFEDDPTEYPHDPEAPRPKKPSHRPKPHKHKSSGAFLLSDPFDDPAADDPQAWPPRARRTLDKGNRTSTRHSHDPAPTLRQARLGSLTPDLSRMRNGSTSRSPGTPPRSSGTVATRRHDDFLQASPGVPSPGSSNASADMDSNQIVNMALNLSESRRLAQRRIAAQTVPPRLAPLPTDNTVAGTLRQQLQQQRRLSRNMSPRPGRDPAPRVLTSGKMSSNGPLQSAFEPASAEDHYRFHFSNSTLARAQKAKDYMELLAQYRRVIELLPPLKPNSLSKLSATELSPSMPMSLDTVNKTGQLGRPYDPLQYIRNRKVRARERKTIDGGSQGFGDVSRVTDWIDDVARWVATRQMRTPGSPALPVFFGADVFSMDHSPPAALPRAANPIVKAKRPRNDWIVEPADLLADVYWLEQHDHKKLVENRHWKRVFPQDSELYRPLSRSADELSPALVRQSTAQLTAANLEHTNGKPGLHPKPLKSEASDHAPSSTREKAREKLREIRGFHRHPTSLQGEKHGHSRRRVRRDSSATSSSSESETRSRNRKGTFGTSDKDLLEKQMLEMMAREAREESAASKNSHEAEVVQRKPRPSNIATAVSAAGSMSASESVGSSHQHSSRGSRVDVSDRDDKKDQKAGDDSRVRYTPRASRDSLDVPSFRGRRISICSEESAPNSPYRVSNKEAYFHPGLGAELSPASSRAASPSRNPLARVKHIFRERQQEMASGAKEGMADSVLKRLPSATELRSDKALSLARARSAEPEMKLSTRATGESHKSHRKTNSLRVMDPGAGLRGLFRGPRIDSVLKSGVSKVSDLFWKKDSEGEDYDSNTSLSDISEDESHSEVRNASASSRTASLRVRSSQSKEGHYLDAMPAFVSASDSKGARSRSGSSSGPLSRKTSRRSARFELLKPPRIDISAATEASSDQANDTVHVSERNAPLGGTKEAAKKGHDQPSLSVTPPARRRVSAENVRNSRHFSWAEPDFGCVRAPLSRREVARLRTMVLCSGVMAMEMSRRAHEAATLTATTANEGSTVLAALGNRVSWTDLAQLVSEEKRAEVLSQPISQADLFPMTAHVLGTAIHTSREQWQDEVESFKHRTRAELIDGRIEKLRQRVGLDLTAMTRTAAEEADEVGGDVVDGQRRKVKAVMDVIDKLLRRRRRRFRWVRRGGWLALEWLLVGFMWYVWFVVTIARVFLGVGKGFVRGVKWLLWL